MLENLWVNNALSMPQQRPMARCMFSCNSLMERLIVKEQEEGFMCIAEIVAMESLIKISS